MGTNSITLYLTGAILDDFRPVSRRLAGGDIRNFFDNHVGGSGDLVLAIVGLLLAFGFARFSVPAENLPAALKR